MMIMVKRQIYRSVGQVNNHCHWNGTNWNFFSTSDRIFCNRLIDWSNKILFQVSFVCNRSENQGSKLFPKKNISNKTCACVLVKDFHYGIFPFCCSQLCICSVGWYGTEMTFQLKLWLDWKSTDEDAERKKKIIKCQFNCPYSNLLFRHENQNDAKINI